MIATSALHGPVLRNEFDNRSNVCGTKIDAFAASKVVLTKLLKQWKEDGPAKSFVPPEFSEMKQRKRTNGVSAKKIPS
jgi:hypothetical protein